jgi:uncharacterized membrane protein YjjP (DUF1212 family)
MSAVDPPSAPARATGAERAHAIQFVLELGRALHVYGTSSPEIEGSMQLASRRFGLSGEFFATPTSIFATFHGADGSAHDASTHLMRVTPGSADLGRRARVDEILRDVVDGHSSADDARLMLRAARLDPAPYPVGIVVASFALVSAGAARVFGLAAHEIALAGGVGMLVGVLELVAAPATRLRRVLLPLSAFVVAAIVALAAGLRSAPTPFQVILAGLITLLPGLQLTTAMSELALDHLASGSARFFGALMTLIVLLFGAALGAQIGNLYPDTVELAAITAPREAVPGWTLVAALFVMPLCFGVLFRALPRDVPWIVVSCTLAYLGSRFGARVLGNGFEAGLGGLLVGLASNVYARALDRPAATTLLPGILLLVPGSIGFQSLFNLLERDVITGVESAFQVATVGMSIVAGLFVANVIVRPRKLDRSDG